MMCFDSPRLDTTVLICNVKNCLNVSGNIRTKVRRASKINCSWFDSKGQKKINVLKQCFTACYLHLFRVIYLKLGVFGISEAVHF